MQSNKGLTVKDHKYIDNYCKSIAKCERHGTREKELRQQIYMLGLYTFRQFHHAGLPADITHPGLNQQPKQHPINKYEHVIPDKRMDIKFIDNRTKAIVGR